MTKSPPPTSDFATIAWPASNERRSPIVAIRERSSGVRPSKKGIRRRASTSGASSSIPGMVRHGSDRWQAGLGHGRGGLADAGGGGSASREDYLQVAKLRIGN